MAKAKTEAVAREQGKSQGNGPVGDCDTTLPPPQEELPPPLRPEPPPRREPLPALGRDFGGREESNNEGSDKNAGVRGRACSGQLILYDGVCGLCNRFVKTILEHDPDARFQFASLQSSLAHSILTTMGKDPTQLKSIYIVLGFGSDNVCLMAKGEAAVIIFGQLKGPIHYLKYLSILPVWLLNLCYDVIAANRYRFFGRLDACTRPNPTDFSRFLD